MFDETLVVAAALLLLFTVASGAAAAADGGVALQDSHADDVDGEQDGSGDADTTQTADGGEEGVPGFTLVVGGVAALAMALLVVRRAF